MRLEEVKEEELAKTYWERLWRLLWKAGINVEDERNPEAGEGLDIDEEAVRSLLEK